ncbi:MAG: hypothetical protein WCI03_13445 [bacterium]
MLVFVVVYLVIGVLMLFRDLTQPITNRPLYLARRETRITGMITAVLFWPVFLSFWRRMFK